MLLASRERVVAEIRTDRRTNVELHRRVLDRVATWLEGAGVR